MGFKDFENSSQYIIKKYFETSLDALIENSNFGGIQGISSMTEDTSDPMEAIEHRKMIEERIEKIHFLLSEPKFFTDRQKQVLGLSLGWADGKYVGCKNVSEISRILGISQPVVFNHSRLITTKLQKYFNTDLSK